MLAPASNASCVLSICSPMVIGTAGLSALVGNDPVIATQMMQGLPVTDVCEPSELVCSEIDCSGLERSAIDGALWGVRIETAGRRLQASDYQPRRIEPNRFSCSPPARPH